MIPYYAMSDPKVSRPQPKNSLSDRPGRRRIALYITDEEWAELDAVIAKRNSDISKMVREALGLFFDQERKSDLPSRRAS